MLNLFLPFLLLAGFLSSAPADSSLPALMKGNFTDDYGIRYTITDSVWTMHPKTRYRILKINAREQYLIARNDAANPSDPNRFTRIDYMTFENMEPYRWGFCLSAYDAKGPEQAEARAIADRKNPRKGCNGYPFSRMKRNEN